MWLCYVLALPGIYIGPIHGTVNAQLPPLTSPSSCVLRHQAAQVCQGEQAVEPIAKGVSFFPMTVTLLIVLQFAAQIPRADAADLTACGARMQEQQNAARNTTNTTELPPELRISYEECLVECGAGMGDVNWQGFSQNFGAWLLPWITLMFQIPFGAERKSYTFGLYRT